MPSPDLSLVGTIYIYGFLVLLPCLCAAAAVWGRWPERAAAALYAMATTATFLVLMGHDRAFVSLSMGVLLIDATVLLALLALAMSSRRGWLIWATSLHAIAVLGHLAKLLTPHMTRLAYGLMEGASGWPAILALAIGILQQYRMRRMSTAKS